MKKAEHPRIDDFELWCWRRLLRVLWTARRSNQSIVKEISPDYSLEGLMLKLKLQYFGHLMQRTDSFEKTLILVKIEVRRWRGQQRMRWLDGIIDSVDISLIKQAPGAGDGQGVGVLQSMGSQRVGHDWATELNYSASDDLVKTQCGSQWKWDQGRICFESGGGQNLKGLGKWQNKRDQIIFYYSWQLKTLRIWNHQFKFWGLEANPILLVSHSEILDLLNIQSTTLFSLNIDSVCLKLNWLGKRTINGIINNLYQ